MEHRFFIERCILVATLGVTGSTFLIAALVLAFSERTNAQSWAMATIGSIMAGLLGYWTGTRNKE